MSTSTTTTTTTTSTSTPTKTTRTKRSAKAANANPNEEQILFWVMHYFYKKGRPLNIYTGFCEDIINNSKYEYRQQIELLNSLGNLNPYISFSDFYQVKLQYGLAMTIPFVKVLGAAPALKSFVKHVMIWLHLQLPDDQFDNFDHIQAIEHKTFGDETTLPFYAEILAEVRKEMRVKDQSLRENYPVENFTTLAKTIQVDIEALMPPPFLYRIAACAKALPTLMPFDMAYGPSEPLQFEAPPSDPEDMLPASDEQGSANREDSDGGETDDKSKKRKHINLDKHDKVLVTLPDTNKRPKRTVRMWTEKEVNKLVKGLQVYGVGNWSQIRDRYFVNKHGDITRTSGQLKDKHRNMQSGLKKKMSDARLEYTLTGDVNGGPAVAADLNKSLDTSLDVSLDEVNIRLDESIEEEDEAEGVKDQHTHEDEIKEVEEEIEDDEEKEEALEDEEDEIEEEEEEEESKRPAKAHKPTRSATLSNAKLRNIVMDTDSDAAKTHPPKRTAAKSPAKSSSKATSKAKARS